MKMSLIKRENGTALLDPNISKQIAEFEREAKAIKAKEQALKKAILKEMQENGLYKVESNELTITYIAESYRETFDKERFVEDHADLYDDYLKISPVRASVRVTVKD